MAGSTAMAQVEGTSRDGGAWRTGDFWRFDRTFGLDLGAIVDGAPGTITFNERFTKTVANPATTVLANSIGGPERFYIRNRSNLAMSGSGLWFIPTGTLSNLASASVQFTILPNGQNPGFDWRRVSDLAEVRENFQVNGTIRARLTAFTTLGNYFDNFNATALISVNIDNGPALEYADFPLETIGEVWTTVPTRALVGDATLALEEISVSIVTIAATTTSLVLSETAQQTFIQNYNSTGQSRTMLNGSSVTGLDRINANSITEGDTLFWSGAAKEFADITFGNSPILTVLQGFRTTFTGSAGADFTVTADNASITNIAFSPSRPAASSSFQVSWSGGGSFTVRLRDHAGNDSTATGTSPLSLTAPAGDDDTVTSGANTDLGSYGVEFISGGVNVELASVRLGTAAPTTPTATPSPNPSATPTPTASVPPTATPTASTNPTPTPTNSPNPTATPTASTNPTATPTASTNPTATPTASTNPTATPTASVPPTSTPTPATPSPTAAPCCPGDANNSGGPVNAQDFLSVQANFGLDNGVGGQGDANCSGGPVNAQDFLSVQANFGLPC